jgi:hypothetical protein
VSGPDRHAVRQPRSSRWRNSRGVSPTARRKA